MKATHFTRFWPSIVKDRVTVNGKTYFHYSSTSKNGKYSSGLRKYVPILQNSSSFKMIHGNHLNYRDENRANYFHLNQCINFHKGIKMRTPQRQSYAQFSTASLFNIILLVQDTNFDKSISLYEDILGLPIKRKTESFAEFYVNSNSSKSIRDTSISSDDHDPVLGVRATSSVSLCCTGYSPILTFSTSDMSDKIMKSLEIGCTLDGAIQYAAHGQVATLRSPDGHMISFYEPAMPV